MAERTAIEVTVDDAGAVTVHVRELTESVRRAALGAVARALGSSLGDAAVPDASFRREWDADLAQRIARIDASTARWVSLGDARQRLRSAAEPFDFSKRRWATPRRRSSGTAIKWTMKSHRVSLKRST